MPLMQGKSKKAFEHNVEAEMNAGKPQDQSLAIAYSIKRKNKKMAKGGEIKSEPLPMPDQVSNDAKQVMHNSGKKALKDADWTGQPTVMQAQRPSKMPLSRPKLVGSDAFSVRYKDEIDEEFQEPSGYKKQPPMSMDEEEADKHGPEVPDMAKQHNNKMKPYAEGGEVEEEGEYHTIAEAIMAKRAKMTGQVDLEENAEEEPNYYYSRNQDILKETYGEDLENISQPKNSNLMDDEREMKEENKLDRIDRIRARMRK